MEARHPAHTIREGLSLNDACHKAFSQCMRNSVKHFNVCGYLASEYMRLAGLTPDREAIDRILREWFDARALDSEFKPPVLITTPGTITINTSGIPYENTQSPNIET